ncbi:HEAT repeat domain-containing protein [Natrarchaeobius oligotrophus]|uniref:HEAT repeat domain-containing protein n=1 Tax=Natrarchaeobius chitinivorans TaxID=1679083 RepID=A0A3N6PD69_NATCH|nr:HEAT repeat domain-containing protein [Natrarchaeobius chitinivorans]RQG97579.1 HEAT repeat domain-containing protein [Natrarchaeobius chitinivorans]
MPQEDPTFLYEFARDANEVKLIEYLTGSEKPIIRYRAAELLGGLASGTSEEARERVVEALARTARRDRNDSVRAAAIDAIYLRDEDGLEQLIRELVDGGVDDPPAWTGADRLTDWLESDHSEFRMLAAVALGRIAAEETVPALLDVFTDADVRVRTRAVRSCGQIGDPRCVDALANRLNDRNEQVRRAAAAALAEIGTKDALHALLPAARSDSVSVRVIAIGEFGRFGNLEPVPMLMEALEDRSDLVRRTAARSILELLANAPSERSHELRDGLADELADAESEELAGQLVTILNGNPPDHVRRNAAWLFGQLNGVERRDDVQTCLVELLDDPDELTARFAMSTLVQLGEPSFASHLREFATADETSEDGTVRAEFVLERLTTGVPSREAVSNAVEYTYVSDPADYTAKKRADERDEADGTRQ